LLFCFANLGVNNGITITDNGLTVTIAGLIVLLLDELLQKGYGLGSGMFREFSRK
jgi:preprotein translocase subunit SecY